MQQPLHDYEDYGEPPEPTISFSLDEWLHLAVSVIVLAVAFSFALSANSFLEGNVDFEAIIGILPYSVGIVVTAFVLHELAHKIAAQRKHMWAEYRSSFGGLAVGLLLSMGLGVVLAAPGAVYIFGRATNRDSGVISIVGPMVNLVLGFGAILMHAFGPASMNVEIGSVRLFEVVALVNAVLALFNMLPVPPLDGSKVWKWSKSAYVGMLALIALLFYAYFVGPASILGL